MTVHVNERGREGDSEETPSQKCRKLILRGDDSPQTKIQLFRRGASTVPTGSTSNRKQARELTLQRHRSRKAKRPSPHTAGPAELTTKKLHPRRQTACILVVPASPKLEAADTPPQRRKSREARSGQHGRVLSQGVGREC